MTTVLYAIPNEEFNTPVRAKPAPTHRNAVDSFSSLSTFHMPRALEVTLTSEDVCTLSFVYPNNEASERSDRKFPEIDPSLSVRLGRHSRKILMVTVRGARQRLTEGPIVIPLETLAHRWLHDLDDDAQFAAFRNAVVVGAVLRHMPDAVRDQLIAGLDRVTGEHQVRD
jgi:hypothetical protein